MSMRGKTAIVGYGETEFVKHNPGNRSNLTEQIKAAKLAIEELEIYKKKLGLARYEFDLGEIDREELTDLELQLLEKQLSMVQSQADCWTSYFKLLKRMDKPLIDILR